jgi:hypothetical protein
VNLYLISQSENNDYNTFDSAVVAAESEDEARAIHPESSWGHLSSAELWEQQAEFCGWASSPGNVCVKLIGTALEGQTAGVVLASFNAG